MRRPTPHHKIYIKHRRGLDVMDLNSCLQQTKDALKQPFPTADMVQEIINNTASIPEFDQHFIKAVKKAGLFQDREVKELSQPDNYQPSKIIKALESFNEELSDFLKEAPTTSVLRQTKGAHGSVFDLIQEVEQSKAGRHALFDCSRFGTSIEFVPQSSLGNTYADTLGGTHIRLPEAEQDIVRLTSVVIHEARHVRQGNDPKFPSNQFRASPRERATLQILKEADALHQQELDRDERVQKGLPHENNLTVGLWTRSWMRVQKFLNRHKPPPENPLEAPSVVAIAQSLNSPLNPRGASWRAAFERPAENPFAKMNPYQKYDILCSKENYLNLSIDHADLQRPVQREIYYNRLLSMEDLLSVCPKSDQAKKNSYRFDPDKPETALTAIAQTKLSLVEHIASDLSVSYGHIRQIDYQENYGKRDAWNKILPDVMDRLSTSSLYSCMNSLLFPPQGEITGPQAALAEKFAEKLVSRVGADHIPDNALQSPNALSDFLNDHRELMHQTSPALIATGHKTAINIMPAGTLTRATPKTDSVSPPTQGPRDILDSKRAMRGRPQ